MRLIVVLLALLLAAAGLLGPGRPFTAYAYWWVANSDPPEVTLAGPGSAVRGVVDVVADARPAGRVDLVEAELDGKAVPITTAVRVDTTTIPDGEHTLTVRAQDRSLRRNAAATSLRFRSDNTPPVFELKPTPEKVAQGHTLVVYVRSNEPTEVQATLGGQRLLLNPTGSEYWAAVGIDADEKPGQQELVVEGRDAVGNSGRAQGTLEVAPFKFTADTLQVPPAMLPLLAQPVRAAEDERLQVVYRKENGPPLWKGPFTLPVKGPISTEFGEVRSYNGGPFQGHHGGTDFQVGMGTPVLAPARARVVLREEVRLRGRIMILDHGGGVYSTYAHLSEWMVDVDQEVPAGQPIAKVGTTGLSTGPHLHWELWVNGKNVDPLEWTEREIP